MFAPLLGSPLFTLNFSAGFVSNLAEALQIYNFSTRVFLLGPSHHYYTPKCALSRATVYKTPIGDLPIDLEGIAILSFPKFKSWSFLDIVIFFVRISFGNPDIFLTSLNYQFSSSA